MRLGPAERICDRGGPRRRPRAALQIAFTARSVDDGCDGELPIAIFAHGSRGVGRVAHGGGNHRNCHCRAVSGVSAYETDWVG